MFDVGFKCGHYKTTRIMHAVPNVDDEVHLTFAEDGEHIKTKVVKVMHVEMRLPERDGNSEVPFAILVLLDKI